MAAQRWVAVLLLGLSEKGTSAIAAVPQTTSLGHFVPKSRVWGVFPTSIFDGPGQSKMASVATLALLAICAFHVKCAF